VVPINVTEMMRGARHYFEYKERCIFCDISKQEMTDGRRVIYENPGFVVVAPFAPKQPFETWILPKTHAASYEEADTKSFRQLADAVRTALRQLAQHLGTTPYTYSLHTAHIV